jgi:hypothetical protein
MPAFIMMPNHIHAVVAIHPRRGDPCDRPLIPILPQFTVPGDHGTGEHKVRPYGTSTGTVGRGVQIFKSIIYHYID